MKRAALIGTLVVSLVAGSAAMAGPGGHGRDNGRDFHREHTRAQHEARRGDFRPGRSVRGTDRYRASERYDARRYRARDRYGAYRYRAPYRYGTYRRPHGYYAHRWVRGERLPVAYYESPYVIADYGVWGLRLPPRGYHWVRVDGDAVLAAVATGIVLDTVFHVFN